MARKKVKKSTPEKKTCARLPKDVRYMLREGKSAIRAGKCEDAMAAFDTLRTSNAKCSKHAAKSLRASFIRGCLRVKAARKVAPIVIDAGTTPRKGWVRAQQERAPMAPIYPGVDGYGAKWKDEQMVADDGDVCDTCGNSMPEGSPCWQRTRGARGIFCSKACARGGGGPGDRFVKSVQGEPLYNVESLYERAAKMLGWTVAQAHGFSLQMLREMVKDKSPKLAHEIRSAIESGSHFYRR